MRPKRGVRLDKKATQGSIDLGRAFDGDLGRQLAAIFEVMSDGVWVCDAETRLLYVNAACEALNQIDRRGVVGKTVRELLDLGNFDSDVTSRVLASRRPVVINQKVKSGRTLLVHGEPVFDAAGAIAYVVGTERDLTELIHLREELEASRATIDTMKSELLRLRLAEWHAGGLVANSAAMTRVLEMAARAAGFDTTVLLTGPTGTGKSTIARVIHDASARKTGAFVPLNCGAVPPTLIEAELFGYAPGAFSGANPKGKPGLVDAADGGTLFLDEVDACPPELQVKLLTFLDSRTFFRVGETKPRSVNVRVIAATNADLAQKVAERAFREDLRFRLMVLPIAIPALRDRPEDVPPLVRRTLDNLNQRYGISLSIGRDAFDALCAYPFPGNVRELQNILERAMVMCDGGTIRLGDLPPEMAGTAPAGPTDDGSLAAALDRAERATLLAALRHCRRQQDLAAALGVSQPTIARLLRKHGLRAGADDAIIQ